MPKVQTLNDNDVHGTIINALSCAAEKYRDNAKQIRTDPALARQLGDQGKRLAENFDNQAAAAAAMIHRLQECDEIQLVTA